MSSWLPRAPSDTEDTLIGTFASMGGTTGAQLLLVGYSALTADEQDDAFALICDARLSRQAEGDSELALMVRSLRRAAEDTGAGQH